MSVATAHDYLFRNYVLGPGRRAVLVPDDGTANRWLRANREASRVGLDVVGDWTVSTVFCTTDQQPWHHDDDPNRPPSCWETLVLEGDGFGGEAFKDFYDSHESALAGHAEVVRRL